MSQSTMRRAFGHYLRTGRRLLPSTLGDAMQVKFNQNHDPANGQFTFGAGGASAGGRLHDAGSDAAVSPGASSIRAAEIAVSAAAGRHSTGDCYKFVKRALQRAGVVSDYLPGIAAKDAGAQLAKRGFTNLLRRSGTSIRSPYDAPVGSVLVYDPTPDAAKNSYGHIEIRTETGFVSDYVSMNARTGAKGNGLIGKSRVLTGVWIKS